MRTNYDVFLQIVDSGSISKACAALNISQPALSKQLQRLEDELKVKLFERIPSGMKLTAYGEALTGPARAARDADQSARMVVERLRQNFSGHIAFGVSIPLTSNLTGSVIAELINTAPGLQLTIVDEAPTSLLERVRKCELEFAICSSVQGFEKEFVALDLFEDINFILASATHEVFHQEKIDPMTLFQFNWVGPRNVIEARLLPTFRSLGLPFPTLRIGSTSIMRNVHLVELGEFLTFMPTMTVRKQLATGRIRPVLPEIFSSAMQFKAVRLRNTGVSPSAKIILDAFITAYRSLARA